MSSGIYLGLCDYSPRQHTRITASARFENGCWIKPSSFSDKLPPIGKVFAPSLPWGKEGMPVVFTVSPNPPEHYKENGDQFVVELGNAQNVRPILDYRAGGLEQARYQCIEVGLEEDTAIFSNEIIIAIADDQCIVVNLTLDPATSRYVSRTGSATVFSLNSDIFKSDLISGRIYEVPNHTVGEKLEDVPWKMDSDLLKDLLKALHKYDQDGPSKKERENLVGVFNRAKALTDKLPNTEYLEDWLPSFCDRLDTYIEAPLRIAETLLQIEPVKQQLEVARSRVEDNLREELEPLVRSQLEVSHQSLQQALEATSSELQALQDELERKHTEKAALDGNLSGLQKELVNQIHRLNPVLGAGDRLAKKDFDQLLKSLRTALGAHAKQLSPRLSQTPPWSQAQASPSERIGFSQLSDRLNKVAREAGIKAECMELLDVGARSGALVILPQAQAETMVPAYARAVSRGDFVRVALGPSLLQLDDLWVPPAKEQPTGFAHAWLEAEINPDQIQLVWLDGLHRTPMDLWLPSLIGALHDEKRPANFLIIASLEENLLDRERSWKELPQATFPVSPETQPCGLSQFYKTQKNQVTDLDWTACPDHLMDKEDLDDTLELYDSSNYFSLKAETALYRALAKVSSSESPISEQLQKMASPRKQGQQWLAEIIK